MLQEHWSSPQPEAYWATDLLSILTSRWLCHDRPSWQAGDLILTGRLTPWLDRRPAPSSHTCLTHWSLGWIRSPNLPPPGSLRPGPAVISPWQGPASLSCFLTIRYAFQLSLKSFFIIRASTNLLRNVYVYLVPCCRTGNEKQNQIISSGLNESEGNTAEQEQSHKPILLATRSQHCVPHLPKGSF